MTQYSAMRRPKINPLQALLYSWVTLISSKEM
jgi:hypothetical protein